jgi:hypothetical protein
MVFSTDEHNLINKITDNAGMIGDDSQVLANFQGFALAGILQMAMLLTQSGNLDIGTPNNIAVSLQPHQI